MKSVSLSTTFAVSALDSSLSPAAGYLAQEYAQREALYAVQPALTQRHLEAQAAALAQTLGHPGRLASQGASFTLPDQVNFPGGESAGLSMLNLPKNQRRQTVRSWVDWLKGASFAAVLRHRLDQLEAGNNPGLAVAAALLRFALVKHLVYQILPAGRSLHPINTAVDNDQDYLADLIPSEIAWRLGGPASALAGKQNAPAEDEALAFEDRGELLTPYTESACHFYLPQWVMVDEHNKLLVSSFAVAEALLTSMQNYVDILQTAAEIAPYIAADSVYQQKRYGMLAQLVNQGRSLANCEMQDIIAEVHRRLALDGLNRGLSISIPYFDDQALQLRLLALEAIPAGRILFVPAFLVLSCQQARARVARDTHLDPSTRTHLLDQIKSLEKTFSNVIG